MSVDDNDDKSGKERRSSKSNETKTVGDGVTSHGLGEQEPVPKNLEFYEWLESLFDGPNQFPEKIAWQAVEGKRRDRLGAVIGNITYRPKSPKPSREELVKLSNKIIADCQYDCDVQRRSVTYQVSALHFAKDSDYYARKLLACEPRKLGSGHPDPRDVDDEEEQSAAVAIPTQVLRHQETMVPLVSESYAALLDRQDRIIVRQQQRITELEQRVNSQADMIERLQSLKEERDRRARWDELKLKTVDKGVGLLMEVAPPMLNQIMGKPVVPTQQSLEAITLRNFINGLAHEQAEALLGKWEDGKCTARGLLSEDQASIFIYVSLCQMPVERIDDLLPGGPHAISNEQMMAVLSQGISMEQLMPLRILFEGRLKKQSPPNGAQPNA